MSIELHCTRCQKLIRAPDNAGGKRGKCPYCGHSMYIPMPVEDEIPLAPVDEEEERRAEEERKRAIRYAADVAHATGGDASWENEPPPPSLSGVAPESIDLGAEVEAFIRAMGASKLDEAEAAVHRLRHAGDRAVAYVEQQDPKALAELCGDLPLPVVKGFLKTLLGRLESGS
ncbi:MAG: hypothetical protein D6788_05985 [Planctomycetota bacterium]|nr:MAG: hypothetical protein D6788_05985 [Planctomycetota bacterium]